MRYFKNWTHLAENCNITSPKPDITNLNLKLHSVLFLEQGTQSKISTKFILFRRKYKYFLFLHDITNNTTL